MGRALAAVALAALVAAAGCWSFPTGDGRDQERTPTPTIEPAELYPPGVTEAGLEDGAVLLAAGRESVNATGYVATTRFAVEARRQDSTVTWRGRATVRLAADGAFRQRLVTDAGARDAASEAWSNGSVTLLRQVVDGPSLEAPRTRYSTGAGATSARQMSDAYVRLLLRAGAYEPVNVRRTIGGARVTLTATGVDETFVDEELGAGASVDRFEARVVVDGEGRVRSMTATLVWTPGESAPASGPARLHVEHQLRRVGAVGIERPGWVTRALEAVTVVRVDVSAVDGRYVKLRNRGPDPIPAGALVVLAANRSSGWTARLQEPVAPGESVYVYVPSASPSRLSIARSKPGAAPRELSGTYTLRVLGRAAEALVAEDVEVG